MFRFLNARLISSLEMQIADLRSDNNRLYNVNSTLSYNLNKAKDDVRKRDDHIGNILYDRKEALHHNGRLQRELTDSRGEAANLRKQVAEQAEEIEDLEEELDAAEAAADCLLERNLQLANEVTQLAFTAMLQPPRVTATELELSQLLAIQNATAGGLREQLEDRDDKIDALKAEVESLKKQRTALVKERDGLKDKNERLTRANSVRERDNRLLSNKVDHFRSRGDKLADHALKLADGLADLINNSVPFDAQTETNAREALQSFKTAYPRAPLKNKLKNPSGIFQKAA